MDHGPCGGVQSDGRCEVPELGPCPFLDALDAWPYLDQPAIAGRSVRPASARSAAAAAFLAAAAVRPVIVADLPAAAMSANSLRACGAELAPVADACLLGDHGGARVQFPPSYRARLLTDAGVSVRAGVNCRDRNRVAIEGEIAHRILGTRARTS